MLVALAVIVLVGVLAVRISVFFGGGVPVAQVGVGQGDEHHDQQDGEHNNAENPRFGPERGKFVFFAFCGNGHGDLLEQHFLP
jgi:hypothetical protein